MDKLFIITGDPKSGEMWARNRDYNRKDYKVVSSISQIQGAKDCRYVMIPPTPKDLWKFTNYINKHNLTKIKVEKDENS